MNQVISETLVASAEVSRKLQLQGKGRPLRFTNSEAEQNLNKDK